MIYNIKEDKYEGVGDRKLNFEECEGVTARNIKKEMKTNINNFYVKSRNIEDINNNEVYNIAAEYADEILKQEKTNNYIVSLCNEIMKDEIIDLSDIPYIIELYAIIKKIIMKCDLGKHNNIGYEVYLKITEIILITVIKPILKIDVNIIIEIIKKCSFLLHMFNGKFINFDRNNINCCF